MSGGASGRVAWVSLLLAGLTFAVFARGLRNDFVKWDDDINIYRNPHIQGLDAARLQWMFTDSGWVRYYAPLSWLGVAVIHQFSGLNPLGYHLANVLLHCANVVLVFLLLRAVLSVWKERMGALASEPALTLGAALGALLWALHPMRVEPVAWATGYSNCQAMMFGLLALLAYLRAQAPEAAGRARGLWLAFSAAAFGLSLLTYPTTIPLPALLVLLDAFVLRRFASGWQPWRHAAARRVWLEKIPFVAVAALFLGVTIYRRVTVGGIWDAPMPLSQFGLADRIMQAFYVWAYYVWRPWMPFDLSPVYTSLMWFEPFEARFVVSALLVAGVTVALVAFRRRWPWALALWLWHLLVLVPMLGLTEHPHYTSDRYNLIASLAWSALLAGAVLWAWPRRDLRWRVITGCAAAIACFALLSVAQIGVWRDSATLFRHILVRLGDDRYKPDIYLRLGESFEERRQFQEARQHYEQALLLRPDFAKARSGWERVNVPLTSHPSTNNPSIP